MIKKIFLFLFGWLLKKDSYKPLVYKNNTVDIKLPVQRWRKPIFLHRDRIGFRIKYSNGFIQEVFQ